MEVTHVEEATKHVVIGGGRNRAFGIANTAEFVTVLSDALYSNKKLAAVREVMCNAWDAHIASGCTDKAIKITFKANSMIIRDYGTGIPDDMIEEIYCIYGESTKRNESNTTGGFGLGSKSPFAISDTFMVTSFHNGTQTVYAVSKGTDETDGLPALRAMVTIPTTQTGLQVEIPILDEDDLSDCREYAEKVALFGEMRAEIDWLGGDTLNYVPEAFGLKDAQHNFMLTSRNMSYEGSTSTYQRIYIQYGAVVYPVTSNKAYEEEYKEIVARLSFSSRNTHVTLIHDPVLVIKAEPDSLSVNPSREVLSYSGHTIRTIKAHIEDINARFQEVRPDLIKANLDHTLAEHIKHKKFDKLEDMVHVMEFCQSVEALRSGHHKTQRIDKLTTMHEIHAKFLVGQYRSTEFSKYIVKKAYRHVQSFNEGRWNKVAKRILFGSHMGRYDYFEMRKYILKDLYAKLGKDYLSLLTFMRRGWRGFKVMSAHDKSGYVDDAWADYNPFQVVVSHNKKSITDYMDDYNRVHDNGLEAFNVISVPRIKKSLSADTVADMLELAGYRVHRVYADLKYTPALAKKTTAQRTKRKTGYPLLRECLTNGVLNYGLSEDAARITKPATYLVVKQRQGKKVLPMFRGDQLKVFLEQFPDTVIVPTEVTAAKLAKDGALDHSAAISQLANQKYSDPAFIKAIAYSRGPLIDDSRYYRLLLQIPEIAKEFGLVDPASVSFDKEEALLDFLTKFTHYSQDSDFNGKVNTERHNLTNSLPNKALVDDREDYLNWVHSTIRGIGNLKGKDRDMALNMIRLALKG